MSEELKQKFRNRIHKYQRLINSLEKRLKAMDMVKPKKKAPPPEYEKIIQVVESVTGINRELILSKKRKAEIVEAKRLTMILLFQSGIGVTDIGILLNKDHSTVWYHTQDIDKLEKYEKGLFLKLKVCNEILTRQK